MISSSSPLSYRQRNESNDSVISKIYKKNTPIELLTLKNQTAFGLRAIPKLSFELNSSDKEKRINALVFLTKILHKPENITQGLSHDLINLLLYIIEEESNIEKQLATNCLYIMSSTYLGSHSLITEKAFYVLKEELSAKDFSTRKNIYEIFNRICSRDIDGVNFFLSSNFYYDFLCALKKENFELQNIILDLLYHCILRGQEPFIPDQALLFHSLEVFSDFLEPHIPSQLKVVAEKCIMALCFYKDAKIHACNIMLIPKLVKLLTHRKREVRANAAGALMNISIDDDAKKIISKTKAMIYLINMLNDNHQDSILYSLKALTNISEEYTARYQLIDNLNKFEVFVNHSNDNISHAAKKAIETISWKP